VTHLSYGGIFNDSIITKCSPDSDSELSLKISPYLMKLRHIKLRRTKKCASFLGHPVVESEAGSHNSCRSESGQNCFAFSKVIAEIKAIILTRCWCFTAVLCAFYSTTGNDLARVLHWGPGYSGDTDPLCLLRNVIDAEEIKLDRYVAFLGHYKCHLSFLVVTLTQKPIPQ